MAVATARLPKSQAGTSSGEDSNQVTYLALPNDLDEDEDMPDDEPGNPDMPTKGNPLKSGSNRGISLSGHCTWKSALTPTLPSESGLRTNTTRHVSECADVKTGAKLETGVCGGRDGTSSLPVFRTPSQCGPCTYSEKVSGESLVTQEQMEVVTPLKTEVWKHAHTFILPTFYPTRPASGCHAVRFCPRLSSRQRMGVTLNSPTKGQVEVVQLNCCDMTINCK